MLDRSPDHRSRRLQRGRIMSFPPNLTDRLFSF